MSGGISATTIALGAVAAAGVATSFYQADQQRKAANQASDASRAQAQAIQDQIANKPQASKAPDVQAIKNANTGAAATGGINAGNASTLLTGAEGIDPTSLSLGKTKLAGTNTLLGS